MKGIHCPCYLRCNSTCGTHLNIFFKFEIIYCQTYIRYFSEISKTTHHRTKKSLLIFSGEKEIYRRRIELLNCDKWITIKFGIKMKWHGPPTPQYLPICEIPVLHDLPLHNPTSFFFSTLFLKSATFYKVCTQ